MGGERGRRKYGWGKWMGYWNKEVDKMISGFLEWFGMRGSR